MNTLKRIQISFVVLLVIFAGGAAAPAQRAAPALSDPIPVEREITIGKLPNGLRYYLRTNSKPEKRAELRLVVKAGSVLEDDDQQGLAHLVEHMHFADGTAHKNRMQGNDFVQSLMYRRGVTWDPASSR